MRMINDKEEQEICKDYLSGLSMTNIAKMRHCTQPRIKNILVKNDIPLRVRKVNTNLKEDYFTNIDTPNKAYFLGLIFTDGSVTEEKDKQSQLRLELKASDVVLLEKYREELGITSKLIYSKRGNTESFLSTVRSDKIVKDLNKYGVVKNKTYLTNVLPKVSAILERDFLRGLIDGDGSIYPNQNYYRVNFTSHSKNICNDFLLLCEKVSGMKITNKPTQNGKSYRVTLTKKALVKKLITSCYKDAEMYLPRKYMIATNIFEVKNEEDIVQSDS